MSEDTTPGSVDHDATEEAKKNKKKKEDQLKKIFSDNKTGRYGKSIDA
ncbi:MAG: hypothetical protein ACYTFK_14790 [Planctomycetota bacterium]|jgi:hypothetical protein